ncbi:hypothetical protein SUGI_0263370 [Cryptomeria japonica]|nr:hypothetical protein SUGI_0263370 [Cryptomeria japonica]
MAIISRLMGSSPEALITIPSNTLAAELATNFKAVPPAAPTKTQGNTFQTQTSNIFFGPVKTNSSPSDRVFEHALPHSIQVSCSIVGYTSASSRSDLSPVSSNSDSQFDLSISLLLWCLFGQ